jgi:methyl-accepting chemotaxis protein
VLSSQTLNSYMEKSAMNNWRYGGSLGIVVILVSIGLTFTLIQYLARPIRALMTAAENLKQGRLDQIKLDTLTRKNDEFGKLAQIFEDAVEQVRKREEGMKQAIQDLHLEIDRDQEARQVSEITETDYFRTLRNKSLKLRAGKEKIRHEKNQS